MRGRSHFCGNMVRSSGSQTQGPAPWAAPPNIEGASGGVPGSMIGAGGKSPHLLLLQTLPTPTPVGGTKGAPPAPPLPATPPVPPLVGGATGMTLGLPQA